MPGQSVENIRSIGGGDLQLRYYGTDPGSQIQRLDVGPKVPLTSGTHAAQL